VLDGVTRRRIPLPELGVEIAVLDWGGDGPPALFHHANGFCAALFEPLVRQLGGRFRVFAVDARGHGDSSMPEGKSDFRWQTLAHDLSCVAERLLEELAVERFALGVGHSFGGTLTLSVAARRDFYQRIVLVDPVFMPPAPPGEPKRVSELTVRSRKRRAVWGSRQEARDFFTSRPLFADWLPEAVDLYVAEGLRDRADGQVELKCAPEVEALVFEGPPDLDNDSAASNLSAPALLLWAAQGNFPRVLFEDIAGRMRAGSIEDLAAGHLVPMEDPARVADSILRFCPPS